MSFQEINIRQTEHPVKLIAEDWALLSAGSPDDWNTMTVSWGGIGEIWGKDAAFVFVRPQRHTMKYMVSSLLPSIRPICALRRMTSTATTKA